MLQKQSFVDLLIKSKTRSEAKRASTWKATFAFKGASWRRDWLTKTSIWSEGSTQSIKDVVNTVAV